MCFIFYCLLPAIFVCQTHINRTNTGDVLQPTTFVDWIHTKYILPQHWLRVVVCCTHCSYAIFYRCCCCCCCYFSFVHTVEAIHRLAVSLYTRTQKYIPTHRVQATTNLTYERGYWMNTEVNLTVSVYLLLSWPKLNLLDSAFEVYFWRINFHCWNISTHLVFSAHIHQYHFYSIVNALKQCFRQHAQLGPT